MKVRFGMLMTSGVGKTGGQCIQRFRGSFVLRNITIPKQGMSSIQNKQRVSFRFMSIYWKDLTVTMRNDWGSLAERYPRINEYGDTFYFTGRQMFFFINSNLRLSGNIQFNPNIIILTPPVTSFESVEINQVDNQVDVTLSLSDNNDTIVFKAIKLRDRTSYLNLKKLKIFMVTGLAWSSSSIYHQLEASVGELKPGDVVGFACRSITVYGIPSPWVLFRCVVI